MEVMETHVTSIIEGSADELVWLLEHPPLYSGGTSAQTHDLLEPDRFEVFETRRGGQYTYHGPGQRIAYVMLDLNTRKKDVRDYVNKLENWVIATLSEFGIAGETRKDRVGVWVPRPGKRSLADGSIAEDKVAAIGVRMRKWVTFHGVSINVEPNLEHFSGIVPCGIEGHGVTSLVDLGVPVSISDVDIALKQTFNNVFEKE